MRDVGVGSNPAASPPWALPAVASLPRPPLSFGHFPREPGNPVASPSSLLKEGDAEEV